MGGRSEEVAMAVCVRCVVSGKVQGVWFRGSTRDRARALGLDGWALNLPDGRVEVLAAGEEQAVNALCQWLWRGPDLALVAEVQCEPVPRPPGLSGFVTG
jgi:acylphosphatase